MSDRDHPLRRWRLSQDNLTLDACAAEVGTVRQVWRDWETGRRIPRPEFMRGIYRLTGGSIEPNDFYDLPPLDQLNLPITDAADAPLLEAVG